MTAATLKYPREFSMASEEHKLPQGWLKKAMAEARESCKDWPLVAQPLLSLNAELVSPPMPTIGD